MLWAWGHARGGVQTWVSVWTRSMATPQKQRPPGGRPCGRKGPQCLAEMRPPHVSLEPGEARPDPAVLGPRGPQVPRAPIGRRFCECCTCGPASPSPQSSLGPQAGRTKPVGRLPTPGLLPAFLLQLFLRSFSQSRAPRGVSREAPDGHFFLSGCCQGDHAGCRPDGRAAGRCRDQACLGCLPSQPGPCLQAAAPWVAGRETEAGQASSLPLSPQIQWAGGAGWGAPFSLEQGGQRAGTGSAVHG